MCGVTSARATAKVKDLPLVAAELPPRHRAKMHEPADRAVRVLCARHIKRSLQQIVSYASPSPWSVTRGEQERRVEIHTLYDRRHRRLDGRRKSCGGGDGFEASLDGSFDTGTG